jgi:D-psicose/D-tagatose/L-ribulose 3-epimerase
MAATCDVYFSFFMFDSNARVDVPSARLDMLRHMQALTRMGYTGFELHIGRDAQTALSYPSLESEVQAYREFRQQLDESGLSDVQLTTNVGTTATCDVSSPDPSIRSAGFDFLKSRVDVTAALRGTVMMGPVVIPYGAFQEGIWSDALQDALQERYRTAAPLLDDLGRYASIKGVKIAIEPITHWETPGPNKLAQTIEFLKLVPSRTIGVVIDSAHETLDGDGPEMFARQVQELSDDGRLHYVQASAPDRGDLSRSWLPWKPLFSPLMARYSGPVAIEIFNAIPAFAEGLRLSRRKFWVPGVDSASSHPSAYEVASASLAKLREEFAALPVQEVRSAAPAVDVRLTRQ